jgi:hypothetical protein
MFQKNYFLYFWHRLQILYPYDISFEFISKSEGPLIFYDSETLAKLAHRYNFLVTWIRNVKALISAIS